LCLFDVVSIRMLKYENIQSRNLSILLLRIVPYISDFINIFTIQHKRIHRNVLFLGVIFISFGTKLFCLWVQLFQLRLINVWVKYIIGIIYKILMKNTELIIINRLTKWHDMAQRKHMIICFIFYYIVSCVGVTIINNIFLKRCTGHIFSISSKKSLVHNKY